MSKYSRVVTEMRNKVAIERALDKLCAEFGKTYEKHENGIALRMYSGSTNIVRTDGTQVGTRMAHYRIAKEQLGSSYTGDLGLVWNEASQSYDIDCDRDYGMGHKIADKLAQAYGVEMAKITAAEMGYAVLGVTIGEDGSINLEVDIPETQYAQTYV